MKTGKIFWGLGFILLAITLILDAVGVTVPIESAVGEISLIALLGALLLLSYMISRLVKGKFGEIFVPLAIIFIIFEKNIATFFKLQDQDIINNWLLIGCAILLQIGFGILLSKRKKRGIKYYRDGEVHYANFSSTVRYIDATNFKEEHTENDLGSLVIKFENADKYEGGGILHIDNNLGSTKIEVPSSWRYTYDIDNSLGSVSASNDDGDPAGPLLVIKGENNLGSVSITLV